MACRWDQLSIDVHQIILSFLWQQKDEASLNAVMQTSRELRLQTSAMISKIKVTNMLALRHFPRHATLRTLELAMHPEKAAMWLQATWAAVPERLLTVSKVQVQTRRGDVPDHLDALLESISCSCPNATSLEMFSLFNGKAHLAAAFFRALVRYLPHLLELRVSFIPETDLVIRLDGGMAQQWATCFPPGLRKLALPGLELHPNLLQLFVNMPSLIELEAFSLCANGARGPFPPVYSEKCVWQLLRLHKLPPWGLINSFTIWPAGFRLEVLSSQPVGFEWALDVPPSHQQESAVGKAAAKLSACMGDTLLPRSGLRHELVLSFNTIEDDSSDAVVAATLIRVLAPLDAILHCVSLKRWRVSSEVLQALTVALPNTVILCLKDCVMDSGAWQRLSVQPRLERLLFLGKTRITLSVLLSLVEGAGQKLEILIGPGCMAPSDQTALPKAMKSLSALRNFSDHPPVTVRIISP